LAAGAIMKRDRQRHALSTHIGSNRRCSMLCRTPPTSTAFAGETSAATSWGRWGKAWGRAGAALARGVSATGAQRHAAQRRLGAARALHGGARLIRAGHALHAGPRQRPRARPGAPRLLRAAEQRRRRHLRVTRAAVSGPQLLARLPCGAASVWRAAVPTDWAGTSQPARCCPSYLPLTSTTVSLTMDYRRMKAFQRSARCSRAARGSAAPRQAHGAAWPRAR
jgi:hypothetical protein